MVVGPARYRLGRCWWWITGTAIGEAIDIYEGWAEREAPGHFAKESREIYTTAIALALKLGPAEKAAEKSSEWRARLDELS
jgi:hypothetical protein